MGSRNPRVDLYIAKAGDFARPILKKIRKAVHQGCPEVTEELKWGFPHFMHKGILCSMAAFKAHCAFGFWKGELLAKQPKALTGGRETAMGDFGRLTKLGDLPDEKTLLRTIKDAVKLNDEGVKRAVKPRPRGDRVLEVPEYFLAALQKSRKALTTFEGFSYSHKKEYVEWVGEAKGEDTRKKRLESAVAWMAEGRPRNWKYTRK